MPLDADRGGPSGGSNFAKFLPASDTDFLPVAMLVRRAPLEPSIVEDSAKVVAD